MAVVLGIIPQYGGRGILFFILRWEKQSTCAANLLKLGKVVIPGGGTNYWINNLEQMRLIGYGAQVEDFSQSQHRQLSCGSREDRLYGHENGQVNK